MDQYDPDDELRGRPGAPVDIGRLFSALLKRWRWFPIAGAVGAVIGLVYASLFVKQEYTARAAIVWEPPSDADASVKSFLTQVDSIRLPVNLMETRQRLKLGISIGTLFKRIDLLFDGSSHLVQLEVTDKNGKNAAIIANTMVEVFLDYQRQIARVRAEEQLRDIEADIGVGQSQLKEAREAYDVFRKEMGVSDFQLEQKLAIQAAAELRQQADLSIAEAMTEGARQKQLQEEAQRQPITTSGGTSLVNPDAAALAQLRTQLAAAKSHLAPDHPQILQLQAQVDTLEARVKTNTNIVQGPTSVMPNTQYLALKAGISQSKVSKEAAMERRETYKRFVEEAERRLQQLSEAEGQAQQLLSRITTLETRATELEAQRVRMRDKVRNAAADFRVVTPASPPEKPNASKRRLIAIGFPLASLLLTFVTIVAYELRGLRVHTAREAGFWANAAVVASSTWPREQNTLGALVDELSDAAPSVRGTTLVVGARVNDVPIAREIAYWLSHLAGWSPRQVAISANEPVVSPTLNASVQVAPGVAAETTRGDALARRPSDQMVIAQAWDGPPHGPSLRRAARLADRVLVIIAAGTLSVTEVAQLRARLGRDSGIGLLLVGLNPELVKLPDRVGEVDAFWGNHAAA